MSQTGDKTTAAGGFGPNEWLVEELYQQYLADKDSVDEAWWDFFQDYRPATGRRPLRAAATAPRPRARDRHGTGSGRPAHPRRTAADAARRRRSRAGAGGPEAGRRPGQPADPAGAAPPPAAQAAATPSTGSGDVTTLKGPAARVVTNMEASLAVPTATSVRAVPAKLLIDNRIVINNHLQRGRGGKVSFTHLIGYAVVKALAAMPEMNYAFAEVGRQAGVRQARARQPRPGHRPAEAGRLAQPAGARRSRARTRWTSPASGRRTRTSSGAPAATS